MNVHVLGVKTATNNEWKLLSVYQTSDTAMRALKAIYKNAYNEDPGCQMRVTQRMVHL